MIWQMINLIKTPDLFLYFILFLLCPLLFSIAFHEMAHGYAAYKFGDITPKIMGRLTLNPIKHLDPLGTILLLVIGLGWAKPVLINTNNIPNSTQQMLVALAGPASNFLLAIIFAYFIYLLQNPLYFHGNEIFISLFNMVTKINIGLAIFNLIPIPPLDGSRILSWMLPKCIREQYEKLEQYGMFIMMLILFTVGFSGIFVLANIVQYYLYIIIGVNL